MGQSKGLGEGEDGGVECGITSPKNLFLGSFFDLDRTHQIIEVDINISTNHAIL
jgi:hypothetical protein